MTTIVSSGQARSVESKSYPIPTLPATYRNAPADGVVNLLRGDGAYLAFDSIFRTQPMVYAAVTKRTNGVARNPLKVYQYGEDGASRSRVRAHPLAVLLNKPYPRGSQFMLKARIAQDLDVFGEAICVKFRPTVGAAPTELWNVPMRQVIIHRDDSGPIAYEFSLTGTVLGPEEVIHFESPSGSPLRPLARTLALEDAAITWQGQSLAQGMTKRGAFVTDQRLTDSAIPRMRAELEKLYSGVENAGKVALLEQGLKFESVGISAVDADLISQRKLSREEVCAAYDIAPHLLGLERATYASMHEYRKALFDSVVTRLALIEETLQAQLVDTEPSWDGLFVEFDTNDLLRPDPEARARTYLMMQQAGVNSINERRRPENLPPIDDPLADAVLMPVNMAPVGEGVDPTQLQGGSAGTPMQGIADQVLSASLRASDVTTMLVPEEQQ